MNKKRKMYWKMVTASLLRRKSRMVIALLAIAIGATILSGLVTIYRDIPRQLGKEFRSYGANLILLPEGDEKITKEQLLEAKKMIGDDAIVGMAPYLYYTTKINEQPYILAGTDLVEAKKNSPFWYIEGDWVSNDDETGAMIGKDIAKTLGLKIGDTFVVKGVKYNQEAIASSQDKSAQENVEREIGSQYFDRKYVVKGIVTTGGAEEEFIFTNIEHLAALIESPVHADVVECSIEHDTEELQAMSEEIAKKVHILARPVRRVTQSQSIVLGKLKALVYIVTVVILIITMISVSTTMMAMISERRKEIGLKKALGAENELIVKEFLGESIVLGIVGGVLGVVFGFYFAQQISLNVFGRAITFQYALIPITIVVSAIVTTLASIYPVRKVLDIHPAIVLRGE